MSERDERFHLQEALKLADALNAVDACRSIRALDALKGIIDQRIVIIERAGLLLGQTSLKTGQTPIKTEKTPLELEQTPEKMGQKPQKTEKSKKPDGHLHPLNFLDIILKDAKEPFTQKDMADILYNHYKTALHHEISRGSAESYTYICVKHMLKEGMIEAAGKKKREGYGRCAILYKKKPKKIVPEGVKDGIYEVFEDNLKKLPDALSVERDLCGTGQSNGDVDDGAA